MSSRPASTTSSPDVLGPEGDALYLISSPVPEFTGRQSWVPPYTIQTPRRKERMVARRTPNKTPHIMNFNDIVLPSSPQMRQRSVSPTKMQSEGNLSPWRIRVTVEAEHEDDENTQDGPRKKLKPSTFTTKVPLKDEESNPPSAKKRRGRPRKSDVREQSLSPIKGSPGHTPKLQAVDSIKRPRGRPRKSLQFEGVAQTIEKPDMSASNNEQLETVNNALDRESPTPFMTTDMGSLSDELSEPDPFLDIAGSAFEVFHRFSPPVVPNIPDHQSEKSIQVATSFQQTTPQESVSPPLEARGISPENTLHAGHTPRARRSYPTPTSSSLIDGNGDKPTMPVEHDEIFADPTGVHHEYDTIMESEDFSMVSLGTLPSAKQAGLSSILSSAKGALKPFVERQSTSSFDYNAKIRPSKSPQANVNHTGVPSTSATRFSSTQSRMSYDSLSDQVVPVVLSNTTTSAPISKSPDRQPIQKTKKPLSFARLVRLGLSLHSALGYQSYDTENQDQEEDEDEEEISNTRYRLEHTFSDFDADTQRRLQAGLRFGELVARRMMESRKLQRQEERRSELALEMNGNIESDLESSQPDRSFSYENVPVQPELSRSQRLEEEWQRQREEVSRQIDVAGSDNVIVLESDDDVELRNESNTQEQMLDEESEEEDGYGDVWQEEARNHDDSLDRHQNLEASLIEDRTTAARNRISEYTGQDDFRPNNSRRYDWDPARGEIPPLGRSRMAQIRDEEVDLSFLLRPRDTPKSRQYYANSSPHVVLSQGQRSNQSSKHSVRGPDVSSPAQYSALRRSHVSNEPENFSSENNVEENEPDQEDNIFNNEQDEQEDEQDEDELYDQDEVHSVEDEQATLDAPPVQPPAATPDQAVSRSRQSWFRRITSNFTPGWWTTSKKEYADQAEAPLDESQSPPFKGTSSEQQSPVSEQAKSLKRSHASMDVEEVNDMTLKSSVYEAQPRSKKHRHSLPPVVLATSGYFTDAHYVALKRLYLEARRYPERFPYHQTARRDDMLGDSLWTSDGEHGLPIAKIQFGILDRFVSELSRADLQNGGRGQIGWTEDDLHKRLFSIIVGDQIRRERREQGLTTETR